MAVEEADGLHGEDGEDLDQQIDGQVHCGDLCELAGVLGCVHFCHAGGRSAVGTGWRSDSSAVCCLPGQVGAVE